MRTDQLTDFQKFDDVFNPPPRLDLFAPGAAEVQHGFKHAGAQMGVTAGQDILDHGAVLEQRQVLKDFSVHRPGSE